MTIVMSVGDPSEDRGFQADNVLTGRGKGRCTAAVDPDCSQLQPCNICRTTMDGASLR